jgi:hypothetical protein
MAALRRLGEIDQILDRKLQKAPPLAVRTILRVALAQTLVLETPAFAAVSTAVKLAERETKTRPYKNLVNAVLRGIEREGPGLTTAESNLPEWLAARWRATYGEATLTGLALAAREDRSDRVGAQCGCAPAPERHDRRRVGQRQSHQPARCQGLQVQAQRAHMGGIAHTHKGYAVAQGALGQRGHGQVAGVVGQAATRIDQSGRSARDAFDQARHRLRIDAAGAEHVAVHGDTRDAMRLNAAGIRLHQHARASGGGDRGHTVSHQDLARKTLEFGQQNIHGVTPSRTRPGLNRPRGSRPCLIACMRPRATGDL